MPEDQNTLLRLLVDSVTEYAIYVLDPHGRVTTWNPGAERIKGYRAEEIVGQHFSRFFPAEAIAAQESERNLASALREGRFASDGWRVRKDGTRFWASVVVTPLRDERGELQGFAKVTRDMSERKAAEALQEAHVRLYHFISTLAHELRNPLAPIRNALSIIKTLDAPDPLAELIGIVDRQSMQIARLVDDLLDVSRITTGKIRLERELVDLNDVVKQAVETTAASLRERNHRLLVSYESEKVRVTGDQSRLIQVFTNLLDNAAKYTPDGGTISVTVARTDQGARVAIKDSGIGIAPDFLPHVFDAFAQSDPKVGLRAAGLGLGLKIVREILHLQGGEVSVSSDGLGRGTEFTVLMPLANGPLIVPTPEVPGATRTPRRILVVDDNRDAGTTLMTWLQTKGHFVKFAEGANEAQRLLDEQYFDAALVDIGMPDIDGYSLARAIRQRPSGAHMLLVAVTGYGQYEDRSRAYEAGFDAHLVKPVDFAVLEKILAYEGPNVAT